MSDVLRDLPEFPLVVMMDKVLGGLPKLCKSFSVKKSKVIMQQRLYPLLDNKKHISRHDKTLWRGSAWSKKQRRAYMRCISGVKSAVYKHRFLFHLVLTSSPTSKNLPRHFDLFIKRIRRELNFTFDYFKVRTAEGFGVIHAICVCDDFKKWRYGAIHAYLSVLWQELHDSPNIWVSVFRRNIKRFVGYIVGQYVCGQTFIRLSYSKRWCFQGFVKEFKRLLKEYGYKVGIRLFDFRLLKNVPFGVKNGVK